MAEHRRNVVNPVVVQNFLEGVNYPTDKQGLIRKARENGAPQEVINTLEQLRVTGVPVMKFLEITAVHGAKFMV